ncbi:oxidoreductase [Amycolatopsis antarctica]|uniref:Oxidoreductase n=1 Tax=Amycolatopsis antarctica TaxID=1854586 RepID=A0A263CVN3_9PSEU|nr:SDR family NAD(P)-dependent oxidoreductase [Amycolatopsis antarctica]OZM70183.1 oxidoreductase [Amycolatopsis antarctica]
MRKTQQASSLVGTRVLITGGARGIGALLARRLHERGARVGLVGLEPELLADTAKGCGDAPWRVCDVADRSQVDAAVAGIVAELGGLDVVVANAGIAKQLPLVGGSPEVMEQTLRVNVLGTYYTLRAAGPHLSHPGGYALLISSLAAAVHLPLLGAYSASKAAVEALGNTLRAELRPSGAKVGVAYFAELDTDMTSRGFDTDAARRLLRKRSLTTVTPVVAGIDALEKAITLRSRTAVAPRWVGAMLPVRSVLQRVIDRSRRSQVDAALRIAREEDVPFTTDQPGAPSTVAGECG